ncbi:MAG: twin-arginine translocase subunit TatB [Alphaproteobacteria bacterium]|nr:MAG: twin-arginine translocase subunit TatB [Alphaproteobacteria bacterium]
MFDIAWSEMLVVAVVLIIVVGPRDLPKVMRGIAQLYGKARSLAGKFRADMDSLAREVELEELRRKVKMYEFQDPKQELTRLIDPDLPGTPAPVPNAPASASASAADGAEAQPDASSRPDEAPAAATSGDAPARRPTIDDPADSSGRDGS